MTTYTYPRDAQTIYVDDTSNRGLVSLQAKADVWQPAGIWHVGPLCAVLIVETVLQLPALGVASATLAELAA